MKITCISNLHGNYPKLDGGDLLIVAGDLTASGRIEEYASFYKWFNEKNYKKKIFIAGNHDNMLCEATYGSKESRYLNFEYLCDSGTEFEGLKIWGSPWSIQFQGMNPSCMAFTVPVDADLQKYWDLIPNDTDILITNSSRYGVFDETNGEIRMGSRTLNSVFRRTNLELHVCGNIPSRTVTHWLELAKPPK